MSKFSQHFLQSPAWEKFQQALGRKVFRRQGNGWGYMAILESGTGNKRLYCPFGPSAKDEPSLQAALKDLVELGRKQGATFLRIGPVSPLFTSVLSAGGWKTANYIHLQPEHTSIIDLSIPEDALIAQMAQPVRNCYRNYSKKGVSVRTSHEPEEIKIFIDLIHQVAQRTGLNPHSDNYFLTQAETLLPDKNSSLWIAEFDSQPIATSMFFDTAEQRIYAHAAADSRPELRKLNAGTAILTEAIIDAKRRGLSSVDLYGIAPEGADKSHPWSGFSKFKRSFGGQDTFSGKTWELPLNPVKYWSYRAYQKLRNRH